MLDTKNASPPDPPQDPMAIFDEDGPINPWFITDAVQTLMRNMPLDTDEPEPVYQRRLRAALIALAATNPRDPIEVMLSVQAVSAYHAASACWRIGMNSQRPHASAIKYISAAASAARTFDTMLRAIERRQAKPLATPIGRPSAKAWSDNAAADRLDKMAQRVTRDDDRPPDAAPEPEFIWSPDRLDAAHIMIEQDRIELENEGLNLDNTDGILPGGGMIMPEDPTPQQAAYVARRLRLMYQEEMYQDRRRGVRKKKLVIRPLRTGDRVP